MKKMNNKGFSLVELIIVIAIMAILIVVLAPQYLKYVERSRNSTDLQTATEFMDAIEVYAADPEAADPFVDGDTFTIVSTTGNPGLISGSAGSKAEDALDSTGLTPADFECQSRTAWSIMGLTGTVQSDGSIEWQASDDGTFAASMGITDTFTASYTPPTPPGP